MKEVDYSGAELKRLRKKKKLKQTDVADQSGISRRQYQRFETGQLIPHGSDVLALGHLFNVTFKLSPVKLKSFLKRELQDD